MALTTSKSEPADPDLRIAEDGLVYGLKPPREPGFRLDQHPLMIQAVALATVLVAWELYGRSINRIFLSYPTAVAAAFVELIRSGELLAALLKSLQGLFVG